MAKGRPSVKSWQGRIRQREQGRQRPWGGGRELRVEGTSGVGFGGHCRGQRGWQTELAVGVWGAVGLPVVLPEVPTGLGDAPAEGGQEAGMTPGCLAWKTGARCHLLR